MCCWPDDSAMCGGQWDDRLDILFGEKRPPAAVIDVNALHRCPCMHEITLRPPGPGRVPGATGAAVGIPVIVAV